MYDYRPNEVSMRKLLLATLASLAALVGTFSDASAQQWPTKQPWWVVPYPAGGGVDFVSRVLATEISKNFKDQIIIDNKPGASTQIAMRHIASSPADGYTVGVMTADLAVTTALSQPQVDIEKDFEYLVKLLDVPMVLIANGKMPFKNLKDFVAYAKANPGKVTAGSIGATSIHHIGLEWFKKLAGIDMMVVPYRGTAPTLQAVVTGEVQVIFMGVGVGDEFIKNGTIVELAVGGKKRTPRAPHVPTFMEEGYPSFDFSSWYGVVAPANLNNEAKARWKKELLDALNNKDTRARIENTGAEVSGQEGDAFKQFVIGETNKYREVGKLIGATK